MNPDQIIAHNLRRAREDRGLTQDEAAELLEPWLGQRWSIAAYSAAERTADPKVARRKVFDVSELLAFAGAFNLPIVYFLIPPEDAGRIEIGDKRVGARDVARALIPPESEQAETLETVRQGIAALHELLSAPSVAMALGRRPRTSKPRRSNG
jgi:transcriptional regulator with XRE-family HTH domain